MSIIKEAIILAGGLGTRLRDTVPGLPKCMAPVAGRPFLFYVINYLRGQGIEKMIFSLGHMHELIEDYLEKEFATLSYETVIEEEPLGTGGAIQLAITKSTQKNIVITNGDTLFKTDLYAAAAFHESNKAECTLLLKPMKDFERYGVVELASDHSVISFKEKQFYAEGTINGGLYILNTSKFLDDQYPAKFSFEKDYLEKLFTKRPFYGMVQDSYFIDIGIPEDYDRAQTELSKPPFHIKDIDRSWTIFIDRDGVINHEKKDGYILNWREFRFYDGIKEAFRELGKHFGKIIIVSNQRGIGRGLMTEEDLAGIHRHMQKQIEDAGGRIDHIYYCTSVDELHPDRKPNPGMAIKAMLDFPSIDTGKSVMIGNKLSDMRFGRNAGMYTVFVATTHRDTVFPHPDVDLRFDSLPEFVKAL